MTRSSKWNLPTARTPYTSLLRPNWEEAHRGLGLILLGFLGLGLVGLPGAALIYLGQRDGVAHVLALGLMPGEAVTLGVTLISLGVLFAYLLLSVGFWRCRSAMPRGIGARPSLLLGLLCLLLGPLMLGAGAFYADQFAEQIGLANLTPELLANLFRLLGGSSLLLSLLLFSSYLRVVGEAFRHEKGIPTTPYFWFVGFLLGGTAGVFLATPPENQPLLLSLFLGGWGFSVLWHLALIVLAWRRVRTAARRPDSSTGFRTSEPSRPQPVSTRQTSRSKQISPVWPPVEGWIH